MYLPTNPVVQKKLVIVRQLFENASMQASSRYSPVSRIMAVIGFDLAVETVLKAIVSTLDTKEQPDKTFEAVLQQANDKLQKSGYAQLPDEANIRYVHSLRNDAQHKAKYPLDGDVAECRVFVRGFLQKLTSQLWGIVFENISLVDLVQNPNAKRLLQVAEQALLQDDYENATRQANAALTWVTRHVRKRLFGGDFQLSADFDFSKAADKIDDELAESIETGFTPIREELSHELDSIRDALLSIAVGMNYAHFVRLQMILPDEVASFDDAGEPYFQRYLFKKKITKQDTQFALNYCIEATIQIEAQIGNVEDNPTPNWEF